MTGMTDINKATVHRKPNRLLTIVLVFLMGGAAHVFLYGVDIADSICQILYGTSILLWGNNISTRVTDKRIRLLLLTMVVFFALSFLMQVCRFSLLPEISGVQRFFWYLYYIPFFIIPLLSFYVALNLNRREGQKISRKFLLPIIPAILLITAFLTNDYHNLAFRLDEGSWGQAGTYSYGPLYFSYLIWFVVFYGISFIIILKKSLRYVLKSDAVIPVLFFALGSVLQVLTLFDRPKLCGIAVWRIIEVYAFNIISSVEACIQTGIISSNTSYMSLFAVADRKIRLSDKSGHTLYASAEGAKAFEKTEDNQINVKEISGGSVSWVVDMSALNKLNREISEATEQIELRNEFLKTDISIKEEHSKIDTRNRLYDTIAGIVKPQIDAVGKLLQETGDGNFDKMLAEAAVLEAYIKRRSNMELLKAESDRLPIAELQTAVSESCEYIGLFGVTTAVNVTGDGEYPQDVIIPVYEAFEGIIEKAIHVMNALLVNISSSRKSFCMRIYLGVYEESAPSSNASVAERCDNVGIVSSSSVTERCDSVGIASSSSVTDCILTNLSDVKSKIEALGGLIKYDTEDELLITVSFEKGGDNV